MFVLVFIGGVVEFVPTALIRSNIPTIAAVKPYTPLELEGRDLYIREGCVGCHSQMIRPLRAETERYGEYSKAGEFVYDHPFLWGSKRTGPDLHRVGGKYPDSWHFLHMNEPRSTSPGSIMPGYPWLYDAALDTRPHRGQDHHAAAAGRAVSRRASSVRPWPTCRRRRPASRQRLRDGGFDVQDDREIVAMIAYLQRLGTDVSTAPPAQADAGHRGRAVMYTDILRGIEGIGIFPVISLVLFVAVFARRARLGRARRSRPTRPARRPSARRGVADAGEVRRRVDLQEARMTRKRDEILDHEADGIREFDNDLPRWWLYGFYFTIVLGALYLVNYHVLPEPLVGPASIQAEYAADVAAAEAARPPAPAAPPRPAARRRAGPRRPADRRGGSRGRRGDLRERDPSLRGVSQARPRWPRRTEPDRRSVAAWLRGRPIVVNAVKVGFPLQGMLPYGGGSGPDGPGGAAAGQLHPVEAGEQSRRCEGRRSGAGQAVPVV